MLPGRDGQPLHLNVHVDLAELRGQPGASRLEAGWSTARAAAIGIPGSVYVTGPDADAAACDAALIPVVSGHIDWAVLDQLTERVPEDRQPPQRPRQRRTGGAVPELTAADPRTAPAHPAAWSIDLLSGPGGFPASCAPPTGGPVHHPSPAAGPRPHHPGVPPHLRKAVIQRDKHCQFPGCTQPPSVCESPPSDPVVQGGADRAGEPANCSAGSTTSSSSTAGAGKSPPTPTAPPPPPAPTDASSTVTAHPPAPYPTARGT